MQEHDLRQGAPTRSQPCGLETNQKLWWGQSTDEVL